MAVSLRNVVKHYHRGQESVEVRHESIFELLEDNFISLMNPPGLGKTTILNPAGGLDQASCQLERDDRTLTGRIMACA